MPRAWSPTGSPSANLVGTRPFVRATVAQCPSSAGDLVQEVRGHEAGVAQLLAEPLGGAGMQVDTQRGSLEGRQALADEARR